MPSPETLLAFVAVSALLAISPGPDNLFVLSQTLRYGLSTGLILISGLCTGLLLHIVLVTLGVTALLAATPWALTGLHLFGSGYLLYLAATNWHANMPAPSSAQARFALAWWGRGLLLNVSNPKVAIFFLAFLPQFAEPERGPIAPQLALLGAVFLITSFCVFALIAGSAGLIRPWLFGQPQRMLWLQRLAGVIFFLLALHLLVGLF